MDYGSPQSTSRLMSKMYLLIQVGAVHVLMMTQSRIALFSAYILYLAIPSNLATNFKLMNLAYAFGPFKRPHLFPRTRSKWSRRFYGLYRKRPSLITRNPIEKQKTYLAREHLESGRCENELNGLPNTWSYHEWSRIYYEKDSLSARHMIWLKKAWAIKKRVRV
jgi:hypothetical protein